MVAAAEQQGRRKLAKSKKDEKLSVSQSLADKAQQEERVKVPSKKSEGFQLLRPAAGLCVKKVKKVVAKPDLETDKMYRLG